MKQLKVGSLPLPKIYVCTNRRDIHECKKRGIPYIVWKDDYDKLVKLVLYPTLLSLFPYIDWTNQLGISVKDIRKFNKLEVITYDNEVEDKQIQVLNHLDINGDQVDKWIDKEIEALDTMSSSEIKSHEINDEYSKAINPTQYRMCKDNSIDLNELQFSSTNINEAIGDLSSMVDIRELQKLHLMPKWLGDIAEVITKNLDDLAWQEGYNKKLGWPAGTFNGKSSLPNLIILDVSKSIPFGIAATMLSLIETLREQANADLIVTAKTSGWYPKDKPLPSPDKLRKIHPRGQECDMFNAILEKHVFGKEWGNVICFGDNDSPASVINWKKTQHISVGQDPTDRYVSNTSVKHVWSYHLNRYINEQPLTGYCRWCLIVSPDAKVTHNTSWAKMVK